VLKFRSVINIVNATASTGKESNNKIFVKNIDQTNIFISLHFCPAPLTPTTVQIKLIEETNEDIPAKCKLKIIMSTEGFADPL